MRFSRLVIRNFRSIGPDGIELLFTPERNLKVLLGPNGSGKTNVIEALAIVLGVFPFKNLEPDERDFHRKNTDIELVIELWLDPPVVDRDVYQKQYEIHGFRFRSWRKIRGDGKGVLAREHYCFDDQGRTITKAQRLYKKPGPGDEDVENTKLPVLATEHSWKLGHAFFLDPPSLERFFDKTTGWSPLGRLFELYRDDFPASHNEFEIGDGKKLPSREAFEKVSRRLADILRTEKLLQIETGLSSRVGEYLGEPSSSPLKIEFSLPSHRELFERWVSLQVTEGGPCPPLPIDRLGSGYRALLRLAVIDTLLSLSQDERKFILLVEEPESYLHVHLKRYFSRVLRGVAGKGHQVVFTTHSPEFTSLSEPKDIARLIKDHEGVTHAFQVAETTTFDFSKAQAKVRRMGNEELLFCSHALLVEGKDDQAVIERLLDIRGVDRDVRSLSVINCDSVDNIPDYVKLCGELRIDFFVFHDEDDQVAQKKRNDRISVAVASHAFIQPSLQLLRPCLEAELGLQPHCGTETLLAKLDGLNWAGVEVSFPSLAGALEGFLSSRQLLPPATGDKEV